MLINKRRILEFSAVFGLLLVLLHSWSVSSQTIEVWAPGWSVELETELRDLLPDFQRTLGIEAILRTPSEEEMIRSYMMGRIPDVLVTGFDLGIWWGGQGLLMPLNRYLDQWGETPRFHQGLIRREFGTQNIYALPVIVDIEGILYSKSAFSESGLDPEKPPRGWEELYEIAQKTTLFAGEQALRIPFESFRWGRSLVDLFRYQNSGTVWWSDDQRSITLHNARGIEAMRFVQDLFRLSYPPHRIAEVNTSAWVENLVADKVAMFHGNRLLVSQLSRRQDLRFEEYGFFVGQRSPSSEPATLSVARHGIAIPRLAQNPDLGWQFMEWFLSSDVMARFHVATGFLASRSDVYEQVREAQPHLLDWYRATEYATLLPILPADLPADLDWDDLDRTVLEVLSGRADPEPALTEVAMRWQEQLDAAWRARDSR